MNRNKYRGLIYGAVIMAVGLLIMIIANVLLKDQIVITFGIRSVAAISSLGRGALLGGLAVIVVRIIPLVRAQRADKRQTTQRKRQAEIMRKYNDQLNSEKTRELLEDLQENMPWAREVISQCLHQLDRIDEAQSKQGLLIESNEATYLRNTLPALDRAEQQICQNFRTVINLCIVANSAQSLDSGQIRSVINQNAEILTTTEKLLEASARSINDYHSSGDNTQTEIQAWIDTLTKNLREG